MRLRVVPLPGDYGQTVPYLLVMDRMPLELTENVNYKEFGQAIRESSGGQCHGYLMVHGELDIE